MSRVTPEMLPPDEREHLEQPEQERRKPLLRSLSAARRNVLSATRAAFLVSLGVAVAFDPGPIGAMAGVVIALVAYFVGWADGRRALAVELLSDPGDRARAQ